MKILVTGGAGMLGHDLDATLTAAGHEVTLAPRSALDVTSLPACDGAVHGHDVVVNAAAWTKVDDAETHEAAAFDVNATGAANLALASRRAGARLVQVSTDYVFAGDATSPYAEDSPLAPRSAYGRTKAAGEWAVRSICPDSYLVRTAWLYGAHGPNFVATMARLAAERDTVSVVDDQRGQPTWTHDLAAAITVLIGSDAPFGTYHGTSTGEATWFDLARGVFEVLGLDPARVLPTTTDAFPRPAPRPAYSVLGHDSWAAVDGGLLPDWRESLDRSVPLMSKSAA
ncbi:dTDP-4-dehydrorhamnose reductase [Lapillicoccus sp.]|uniref:dTDP-4-dehydrorhamnose reductase n=1 Tax=Lapillicoccus sp. TaxID=1909287 RepID=UPI0025ECDC80|nr:dTDP-4-dehydrorhamnose reductase [Lapillicoccus sp.]